MAVNFKTEPPTETILVVAVVLAARLALEERVLTLGTQVAEAVAASSLIILLLFMTQF